jgi:predicted kinase
MPNSDPFEEAINRMRALVNSHFTKQLQGANEAKTRLLIIDEVLNLLGWTKTEFEPEQATPVGTYTDYRLTLEGQPRLIVEAKRVGVIAPLPKAIQRPEYANSFLFTNYGPEMTALLQQCQGYCVQCGVPYALATTGEVWIILIGFKFGVEWGKLKSVVFHSLEDVLHRFGEFYGLVSRAAIKTNSLEEKFGSMVLIKPSVALRPREHANPPTDVEQPPERQLIRAFFDQFMGDITHPDQASLLEHCYVDDPALNEFSRELQRILQYDAALDEIEATIDQMDADTLERELELQSFSGNPKTILLVGNVGAGKSTFVHRFIQKETRPKRYVCTVIDLINKATIETVRDRAEEQRLAELVLNKLAEEFEEQLDPFQPEVLRACFEVDVARFRKQRRQQYEQDPERYRLLEEEHIFELSQDHYKHLVRYIIYARKKGYKVWITLDNVDRGSDAYQQFVYSFAHQLAADAGCVTLITLRQDTFLEAQGAGFLDVRSSDIVFRIKAPEFRRVVSKRRKYVDWIIEHNEVPRPFRGHISLLRLLSWHLNRLVLDEQDAIRLFITFFCLNNIRDGLAMLRDYYTCYHATIHEVYQQHKDQIEVGMSNAFDYKREFSRFLQALMLGDSWTYESDRSELFNVFSVDPSEKISHFLLLRILAYLGLDRNASSSKVAIKYDKLCSDFLFLGYPRHHINNAIRKLLGAGLIASPNLPASSVTEAKVEIPDVPPQSVALSARGHYYLHKLVSHPYYQMRAGEDTVWYEEELAQLYLLCLQEANRAQTPYDCDDALQATEAREIFLKYLRRSLLDEMPGNTSRFLSKEWAQIMNDIVERSLFGESVTRSTYVPEGEGSNGVERLTVDPLVVTPLPPRKEQKQRAAEMDHEQLLLFSNEELGIIHPDYGQATKDAVSSLGQMPKGIKLQKSESVVRVLWALEVAFQAGLGPLRASDIARLIQDYGKEPVSASNVAHFFQKQRQSDNHTHLWKEEPKGYYTINQFGRTQLSSLLKSERKGGDAGIVPAEEAAIQSKNKNAE